MTPEELQRIERLEAKLTALEKRFNAQSKGNKVAKPTKAQRVNELMKRIELKPKKAA